MLRQKRLLWFVDRARTNQYPNTATLAAHFSVSRATAKRDIRHLRVDLGAPLVYRPAQRGFALADPTWRLGELPIQMDHTLALAAARRLLEGVSPDLALELAAAVDRTRGVEVDPAHDRVLHVSGSRGAGQRHPHLRALLDACARRLRLRFAYASPWSGEPPRARVVSPWFVHLDDGHLYLHGCCHLRRDSRCFSLAGIRDVELLGDRAMAEPRGFRQRLDAALGVGEGPVRRATVALHGNWARYVEAERWHPEQRDRWEGDVLIRSFPFALLSGAVRRLLCCGGDVEVLTPPDLREALTEAFAAGAAQNGGRDGRRPRGRD